MPVVYKCSKCGTPIYVFERVGQDYYGIPSPSELIAKIGAFCPNCGKPISVNINPEMINIRRAGTLRQLSALQVAKVSASK